MYYYFIENVIHIFFTKHCYIFVFSVVTKAAEYHGKYLGPLKSYHHSLGGDVYAVDARTLHIRNFVYDGEGPGNHYVLHIIIHTYPAIYIIS